MSDSVQPQRRQSTRLPRPWDSPGKNTGVGCHFLLQCMKVKSESEVAQLCPTLCDPMYCSPPGSSIHGIFQARVLEWVAIAFCIRKSYCSLNSIQQIGSLMQALGFPGPKPAMDLTRNLSLPISVCKYSHHLHYPHSADENTVSLKG